MKYITTENVDTGEHDIFVFPDNINHNCMAEVIMRIKNHTQSGWQRIHRHPVSAGFISAGKCHGESISLRLKSNPERDTALFKAL